MSESQKERIAAALEGVIDLDCAGDRERYPCRRPRSWRAFYQSPFSRNPSPDRNV